MKRTLLVVTTLWLGCNSPTAPSTVLEGIVIYEHPQFRGRWKALTADVEDLDDLSVGCVDVSGISVSDDWDDCISSIRVARGWSATIYDDPRYRGDQLTITADVADLDDVVRDGDGDWDDRISSIRVARP